MLEHVKRMNHLDPAGYNVAASMTCILPMAQTVYTGDEDGRVVSSEEAPRPTFGLLTRCQYEWDCIQRGDGR